MLRAILGLALLTRTALFLFNAEHVTTGNAAIGVVGLLSGALLTVGFLTTIAALFVCILCSCALASAQPGTYLFGPDDAAVLAAAMGTAIALLGPGALSIDARLFGPREIIIPPPAGISGSSSGRIE